jgi:hypothetical protein
MGAWGCGAFDNDDALDFVGDLETTQGTGHLFTVFSLIPVDEAAYVEAPEAAAAIAAAEVVAALLGRPSPALPEEMKAWVARHTDVEPRLVREALRVVERVLTRSELRELWEEGGEFQFWQTSLTGLAARLQPSDPA